MTNSVPTTRKWTRATRLDRRRNMVRFVAFMLFASSVVALPVQDAQAMTCDSSAGAGYTVNVCIDVPLNGATVSGDTNVTATVSATGGPGVAKVQFYLDSAYLLTDYESPYTFTLPTDTFVDGVSTLEVEAVMRDAFVTNRTSISAVFSNGVTTPPPAPTGFTPSLGTTPSAGEPFVVAATGDGASGQSTSDNVVNTISAIDPNLFLYLGDVYERGTYTEFKNWYGDDTRFGSFASITNPILGNHERSGGQWPGYDYYWGTPPADYSYDVDGWHFIGMNLQLGGPQSSQTEWLAADLAANTSACTVAYFHYPVLSVGPQGDTPNLFSTWTQLVDAGVDIVLTGHDHSYQRWVPMDRDFVADPDGATQFVLGTGGHGIQSFARTDSRLAAGADTIADAYGALKLELNTDGAAFSYINTSGNVLDAGTVDCGNGTADVTPPSVPGNVAGAAVGHTQVDVSWSPSTDNVGVDSYEIFRNGSLAGTVNGATLSFSDIGLQPSTTYSYTVEAVDGAGNRSGQSTPALNLTTLDPPSAFTVTAFADSWVDGSAVGSNFGAAADMRVDGSPDRRGYVRFDVSGVAGAVTSATLRVYANSSHSAGYEAQEVSSSTWGELSITYANAPGFGPSLGTSGPTTGGTYSEVDVTGYVDANGQYSFALTPLNNTNLRLATRESANPPELVIVQDVSGNTPPTAGDVVMATDEDVVGAWTPVVSDPDPDTLTCSIVSVAGNGSASVASDCSTGSYTPDADYNGPDSFVYQVSDGSLTDTGAVSVTVNPINDAPAADAQSVSVTQDGAVTVTMTGSDNDGDCPLTFAPGSPSNGSLGAVTNAQCNGGVASADVVYTPNASYTGTDSFTFTVEDPSTALSPPATVSLSVDPPQTNFTFVSAADSYVSASSRDSNYGSSTQIRVDGLPDRNGYVRFDVSGVAGAVTSATLRVYANSKHSQGFKVQEVSNNTWGELSITYANAPGFGPLLGASGPTPGNSYVDINVTGYVDANGQYSFALTPLNNTNLRLATRESANPPELVIVQDVSGNTPPTAGDVVMATDEDVVGAWTPVVSDPDPDTLTCSIVSVAGNGSASVASDCSTGSYTPDADYNGPDSFVYQVSDGSLTDTGAVSVTVNPINDAPAADAQSVSVTQDGAVTVTMTGSDNDGDCPLTFAPGSPSNGSLGAVTNAQCNGGVASADVVYTPNASYTGTDSFTFTVEDPSTALSPPATVSLSVDPPQTALTFDITRDALTYSAVSQNTSSSYTGSLKSVVESALEELKLAGGGNILFAAGEMDLGSDHFEIDGVVDVTFAGQGMGVTTIQNFTNASADTEPFDAVRSDRLTIRDLTVSAGGSDRTTSDALDFDGGDDILIERVEVTDSRGRGIVFDGKDAVSQTGGTAERNVIRDCIVTNVPRDGIQLLAANGNTIENCHISNAGAEGIRVHLSSSSSAQPNKPSNDNTIRGNLIEDSAGNGITVTGGSRNLITGNTIVNNGTDGIRVFTSVSSLNCDDNVVDSNSAQGNRYGLIIASSQCHRTVVGDNNFTGNSSGAILDNGTDTIYTSSDTEAPSAPGNLATLDVQATQVTLGWDASTDNVGVTGYDVYRDGGLIDTIGTTTTYQDTTVTPLTTYQYEVRGRDATGNISDPSNGVNATTPAGSPVLTLFPVDDATVRESLPTNNYGSSPALEVDGSSIKDVLMSFDVSGIGSSSITSATLRLYAVDSSSDGGNFFAVTDTTWNETSVTWATAPPGDGGALGSLGSVTSGNWYELDVTALITGDGKVSIRVSSTNSNGADYASKEDSSGNIPELVIVTQ